VGIDEIGSSWDRPDLFGFKVGMSTMAARDMALDVMGFGSTKSSCRFVNQ
jgi:hypothetical protein